MPDKVVLITGAGKRLGRFMAEALGADGWRVIVHHNASADAAEETAEAIRSAGGKAQTARFDLEDSAGAAAFMAGLGRADALINNASVFEADRPDDIDPDRFLRQLRINLMSPVLLASEMARAHSARNSGCVINLLDQKLFNLNPDHFTYTLSKAALKAATEIMARDFAPAVRVNAIAPGLTLPAPGQSQGRFEQAHVMNPMQGGAMPGDHVRAVRFILDTPALTGQTITIDGGEHFQPRDRDISYLVK